MNPGNLRSRLKVQTSTSRRDAFGKTTQPWADQQIISAQVKQASASERLRYAQQSMTADYKIILRSIKLFALLTSTEELQDAYQSNKTIDYEHTRFIWLNEGDNQVLRPLEGPQSCVYGSNSPLYTIMCEALKQPEA